MIVVKIELHSAITRKITQIGVMEIANVGGTASRGDYLATVFRRGFGPSDRRPHLTMRSGEVKNYPRLTYNVWRLVARALLSAFPEEDHGTK